jgi:hypothetical protein
MSTHLLIIWLTFTGLALAGVTAVLVWGIRTRQFRDQDRLRHLPLESGIPEESEK